MQAQDSSGNIQRLRYSNHRAGVHSRHALQVIAPQMHHIFDLLDAFLTHLTTLVSIGCSGCAVTKDKEVHLDFFGLTAACRIDDRLGYRRDVHYF